MTIIDRHVRSPGSSNMGEVITALDGALPRSGPYAPRELTQLALERVMDTCESINRILHEGSNSPHADRLQNALVDAAAHLHTALGCLAGAEIEQAALMSEWDGSAPTA
jgi:hypothetical protein